MSTQGDCPKKGTSRGVSPSGSERIAAQQLVFINHWGILPYWSPFSDSLAGGKAKIRGFLSKSDNSGVMVIADGAAFGPEMDEVHLYAKTHPNVYVYLPESFEWIILSSGLIDGNRVNDMLTHVEDFVESKEHFSWERFFTHVLIHETAGTNLDYSKNKLNPIYLGKKARMAILGKMGIVPALLCALPDGSPT